MSLDNLPIFAMLKNRLSYLNERQQVIAQNVANSDTPGFTPMDLKPFSVPGQTGLAPVRPVLTSPMHMLPPGSQNGPDKPVAAPDSETTLDGNSVVLEDEMTKMSEARIDFDAAIGFYEQSMNLIETAAKRPGP